MTLATPTANQNRGLEVEIVGDDPNAEVFDASGKQTSMIAVINAEVSVGGRI